MEDKLKCTLCQELIENKMLLLQNHLKEEHGIVIDSDNFDNVEFDDYWNDILSLYDGISE